MTQDEKLDLLLSQMGEVKGEIGTIKGEIGTIKGEIGTIKGEIGTIKGEIGTINQRLDKMDGRLDWLESMTDSIMERQISTRRSIKALDDKMDQGFGHVFDMIDLLDTRKADRVAQ